MPPSRGARDRGHLRRKCSLLRYGLAEVKILRLVRFADSQPPSCTSPIWSLLSGYERCVSREAIKEVVPSCNRSSTDWRHKTDVAGERIALDGESQRQSTNVDPPACRRGLRSHRRSQ